MTETVEYMPGLLRNRSNTLVGVLDKASEELKQAPDIIARLLESNDPEAQMKLEAIRKVLGNVATALQETREVVRPVEEADIPATPDIQKALLVAESGIYFRPGSAIANL